MALPKINKEYSELLSLFAKHRVRYLVVGAYAVIYYSEPRYTKDIDVWIEPGPDNALKTYRALTEYGAPLRSHTYKDFMDKYSVFQIGVEPVRIDVLMSLPGVRFETAWKNRNTTRLEGVQVNFISKPDLIRAKRAAGRRRDLDDLDSLQGRS